MQAVGGTSKRQFSTLRARLSNQALPRNELSSFQEIKSIWRR
jgi:hypothetical protein